MALEIKNAPGRPGYAHLVFGHDIDADPLRIAVYNFIKREYLGPSVGKPNWTPARAHFFPATLVERSEGRTTYLIGPEITTFIPDETTIEISSHDSTVRETAVWTGILLDFQWRGPATEPAAKTSDVEEGRRLEMEAKRRQEDQARHQEEQARVQREEAERSRREAAAMPTRGLEGPAGERQGKSVSSFGGRLLLFLALVGGLSMLAVLINRPPLPQFSNELEIYEKARLCAAPKACGADECFVEYRRAFPDGAHKGDIEKLSSWKGAACPDVEAQLFEKARVCAAPKMCGANECLADYRRAYPDGRFKPQIDQISMEKGIDCGEAESRMFEKARLCAAPKACGADECFVEYRRAFPDGAHKEEIEKLSSWKGAACPGEVELFEKAKACAAPKMCGANECLAEYRRLYPNGWLKAQINQIAEEKGIDCGELERRVFEKAKVCAAPKMCGANECLAEYRRLYPTGRFKPQIDQISGEKGIDCSEFERQVFEKAKACAAPKTCGANECLSAYRWLYPTGRFKSQIDQISEEKGIDCDQLERDRAAYEKADRCARSLTCGALTCVADYRRDFPNGRFKAQIDQIASSPKAQSCQVAPPPTPVPSPALTPPLPTFRSRAGEWPGFDCTALRNPEPIEEMICLDGDFARENGELQKAFDRKMSYLGPADRAQLRQAEREWIRNRDSECSVPRRGVQWDQSTLLRIKTCFLKKTRERRDDLSQPASGSLE